jgi:hypothetical protein
MSIELLEFLADAHYFLLLEISVYFFLVYFGKKWIDSYFEKRNKCDE